MFWLAFDEGRELCTIAGLNINASYYTSEYEDERRKEYYSTLIKRYQRRSIYVKDAIQ